MTILVTLFTTGPTWTILTMNLGLHDKTLVTDYLSNGMTCSLVLYGSRKFLLHLYDKPSCTTTLSKPGFPANTVTHGNMCFRTNMRGN